ncbi:MAG TPA: transposase [Gaiellaceae bacterium]|nr:transposase [Gaiellaceae bacterium]
MARPLRLEVAGGIYHLTARGNERRAIFRDANDRARFLDVLGATCGRFRWSCLAYCLMTNHYHLLVRTREPNLARGMRDLNGVYAQAFNRRHRRVGHLFQGRYRAILVEAESQLHAVVAYILRNPVRAGMCTTPGLWPWSSHEAALGARPPGFLAVGELLDLFADDREQARRLYCELVERETPTEGVHGNGAIAGSNDFLSRHLRAIGPSSEIPAAQRRAPLPPLGEVLVTRDVEAIARAYESGHTMPAIARVLGVHPSTVSRQLGRYHAQRKT